MTLLDRLPFLPHPATSPVDPAVWPRTTTVDPQGRLCVGGLALTDIADRYGTPAYVVDEADFRSRLRDYRSALPDAALVYAAKSLLTTTVARWVAEAGAGVDVSSAGELATALAGGVDPAQIVLHGNGKPPEEVCEALVAGVGRVVIDSLVEIAYLACAAPRPQPVLVRITPVWTSAGTPRSPPASPIRSSASRSTAARRPRPSSASSPSRACGWWGCTATSDPRSPTPRTTTPRCAA